MTSTEQLTAKQLYEDANELALNENFDEAIKTYSDAIGKCGTEELDLLFNAYLGRSQAYVKLKNGEEALKDAQKAFEINSNDAKVYLRQGAALFLVKRYEEAIAALEKGQKMAETGSSGLKPSLFNDWLAKSRAQWRPVEQPKAQVESSENVLTPASAPAPKPVIKHEWYQTESHVTISILAKNIIQKDVAITPTAKTLKIESVNKEEGEEIKKLDFNFQLAHDIVPESIQIKYLANKIEIKLKKVELLQWKTLEMNKNQEPAFRAVSVSNKETEFKPNYPTSSKKPKDWDKMAADITAEEKDEKLEGDAALNKLFKDIYANGSDEVRKAMNKSFAESGGTVLSTNWSEIGSKKQEVKAPDGLEWKKWD